MSKPWRGLFILDEKSRDMIYGCDEIMDLTRHVQWIGEPQTRESIVDRKDLLAETQLIFSGWGGPVLNKSFLDAAPNLQAVFYGAGAMGNILTDAVFDRGLVVTSAWHANAVPVAEYSLSMILFSLKHGWRLTRQTQEQRCFPQRDDAPGCYHRTVGLISLGAVGRALLRFLQPFDLRVIVYDPFVTRTEADALGVERAETLEALFARSHVVSLHAPCMPETHGMITGSHLELMKPGATFINTARGAIVMEEELLDVATRRSDLQFILDVTHPEPPPASSPLYTLRNVVLTPHIAGSVGNECRRMGRYMVQELERFVAGQPLRWQVTRESIQHNSHRPAGAAITEKKNPSEAEVVLKSSEETTMRSRAPLFGACRRAAAAAGFTLVELLVVIAIVSVMFAMLLPSLRRVRQQAVRVNCMSNMRTIGQLLYMYANDNRGYFPGSQGNTVTWTNQAETNCFLYSNMVNVNGASLPAGTGNGGPTGMGLVIRAGYLRMSALGNSLRILYCPGRTKDDSFSYYNSVGFNGYPADPNKWCVDPKLPQNVSQSYGFWVRQAHYNASISYYILNSGRGLVQDERTAGSVYYDFSKWSRLGSKQAADTPLAYEVFGWSTAWSSLNGWIRTNHGKGYNILCKDGSVQFYVDEDNLLDQNTRLNGSTGMPHMATAGSTMSNSGTQNNRWGYSYNEWGSGIGMIEHTLMNWPDAKIQANTPW
jgi:prepilin-type N-terminal cleavage/methylation domain-containing protein